MDFLADLHIHSHFSLATSKQLVVPQLELWGKKKGITVIGTGDASHPGWLSELKTDLRPCGNGLFAVKKSSKLPECASYTDTPVYFLLTAEISCIYRFDGRVRKIHNIVWAPSFSSFEKIQKKLASIGNITSDGRPILGMDSRDLLECILDSDERAALIPAHIWTPWFSVLGSKSGFNTIDECYRDLSKNIFAVETGLSSDPPMNRRCSFLDKFTLISNSDAHSPEKLGREVNRFSAECSYHGIVNALKNPSEGFKGTVEYFPEEGKYHLDGHRACNIRWEPEETLRHKGICPVCGKTVTVGVLHRVNELADRKTPDKSPVQSPFTSLTSLKSIIAEALMLREQSRKVNVRYDEVIKKLGAEFTILTGTPVEEIHAFDPRLAEGIARLRRGKVRVDAGYDGVFGSVRVYER